MPSATPTAPIDPNAMLKAFIANYPTQAAAAAALGISKQYLNDILSAHRPITDTILTALGLRRIETIVRMKPDRPKPKAKTAKTKNGTAP